MPLAFRQHLSDLRRVAGGTFARQAWLVVVGDGITTISVILAGAALARALTRSDMGTYREVQYLTLLTATLAEFGLGAAVYRYWADAGADRRRRLARLLLVMSGVTGAAGTIVLAALAPFLSSAQGNPELRAALLVGSVYPFATVPLAILRPVLICRGFGLRATLLETLFACGPLIVLVAAILAGWGFIAALTAWSATCVLRLTAVPIVLGRDLVGPGGRPRREEFNEIVAFSGPIQLSRVPGLVLSYLDKIVMSVALSPAQFAIYSNGARELPLIGQLGSSVASVAVPRFVREHAARGFDGTLDLWRRVAIWSAAVAFPIGAFSVVYSRPIMEVLFSAKYRESAGPFAVFACLTFIRFIDYGSLAKVLDQTGIILRASIVSALFFLLAAPVFAWLGGPIGMAISVVLGTAANAALLLVAYRQRTARSLTDFFPVQRLLTLLSLSFVAAIAASAVLEQLLPVLEGGKTITLAFRLGVHASGAGLDLPGGAWACARAAPATSGRAGDRRVMTALGKGVRKPSLMYLATAFPPISSIASVRSKNVAKHLARQGWRVRVVCLDPRLVRPHYTSDESGQAETAGIERIETGFELKFLLSGFLRDNGWRWTRLVKRVARRLGSTAGLDEGLGWIRPALAACRRVQPGDVDLVFATGSPFMTFVVARKLARRLGCPFLLDYRDPWTASPHQRSKPSWVHRLERGLLKDAAAVTTVSPSWTDYLRGLDPSLSVSTVTNGYDPETTGPVKARAFDGPAIVHAGAFYPPKRVLDPVLRAVAIARAAIPRLEFHHFGPDADVVTSKARDAGILDALRCHGIVGRDEAWSAIKGALASVVITSVEERADELDKGVLTGKIFEAIGMRTPILLVAPPDTDVRGVLARAHAGESFTGNQIDAMANYLLKLARGQGRPGFEGADTYAWPSLAGQLDATFRSVLECRC